MDASCSLDVVPVKGAKNILFGGEGLFLTKLTGPGRIIVFAAGNDNILAAVLPEIRFATSSVNVAAVDQNFTATDFTNYSIGCNISAPGKDIYSSFPVQSFKSMDGTSMAAPIVTGTIALMKSLNRNITVDQAIAAMKNTGRNVGNAIPVMVLADKALQAVRNGNTGTPSPNPNPNPGTGDSVALPAIPVVGIEPSPGTGSAGGDDYADIRRQIEQYKRRISELEGMLPENQR